MTSRAAFGTWMLPASVTLVIGFMLAPVVSVVWISVFRDKVIAFPPSGYTLHWYAVAWGQDAFRSGLATSLGLACLAALGSLLVGVPAGFMLGRRVFLGRELAKTVLLSPLMVPGIVAGSALYIFYIQVEIATGLQFVGTLAGLALAHVVLALPWTVRLVTAALVSFDVSIEEAARTLGASKWTITWRVILPVIRPAMVGSAIFSFIASFVDLEKSLFLIGPGRTTLPIAMINYLEWSLDPAIAAIATIQISVVTLGLLVGTRFFNITRSF